MICVTDNVFITLRLEEDCEVVMFDFTVFHV